MLNHKTKKLPNGNVALCYQMRSPLEKPWIIIVVGALLGGLCLIEYVLNNTTYSLLPLSFIFLIAFSYWALYPCRFNEELEEWWMRKNVDLRLHNVLRNYEGDVREVKRKFYQVTVGTYGKVTATYMLVLLSNGDVLEYELKCIDANYGGESSHEFTRTPTVCTDKERIKAIKGWSFAEWWNTNVYTKENRSKLWIAMFFLVSIGLTVLGFWLWTIFETKLVYAFIGYIVFFVFCQHWIGNSKNKVLKAASFIVSLPVGILYLWLNLIEPIMTVIGTLLFTVGFVLGIPALVLMLSRQLLGLEVTTPTIVFLSLSIGTIICVFFSKLLKWLIKTKSPLRNWGNHKYEAVREELALYIIEPTNINFLIYLAYFVFLVISGFMHFQYNATLVNKDIDDAVLKAFLVFIAYSNVVKNHGSMDFKLNTFVGKVFKLIFTHDDNKE